MNWDQIEGKWKQFQGAARKQWGKLSDDELDEVDGDRQVLMGKLQEKYGMAEEEAEKQIRDWQATL